MKPSIRRLLVLLLIVTAVLCAVELPSEAASLRRGSSGDDVIALQKKLKNWGYYSGSVDGKFGAETERAAIFFPTKHGRDPDGAVGQATAKALGLTLTNSGSSGGGSATSNSSGDVYLLARCIYGEARGEPYKGQVAVGAVILNRVKSSSFPNSISGVIYQQGAFSVVADGQINLSPNETAIKAAKDAMNGYDPTGGCLYYYNPDKTTNKWIWQRPVMLVIGRHRFCK